MILGRLGDRLGQGGCPDLIGGGTGVGLNEPELEAPDVDRNALIKGFGHIYFIRSLGRVEALSGDRAILGATSSPANITSVLVVVFDFHKHCVFSY